MKLLKVYIDGASRGNPGSSGVGVVFCDQNGDVIKEFYKYIGIATNNQAEYRALIFALDKLKDYKNSKLCIYIDSEILYKQITGEYRVKDKKLRELFKQARYKIEKFPNLEFVWIPREKNKLADKLSQKAINLEDT